MTYSEWNGKLQKAKQGGNWTYILEEEDEFNSLGFTVLQPSGASSQEGLLHCAKIRYNGQIKLIYFSKNYVTLPTILASLPMNSVWTVFYKL